MAKPKTSNTTGRKATTTRAAAQPSAKERARTTAESVKEATENTGLAAPSVGEVEKARKEGVAEAIKEDARESYEYATDGALPGAPPGRQFTGYDEIMPYERMLGLGVDEFESAIAEDAPSPLPEEKVYGLLALERNGQNRTPYVKAAIKRLGLKEGDPLPGGGPGYTNDVQPVSDLYS